jgi:gluconate 2-dehydrogenase gamma chain
MLSDRRAFLTLSGSTLAAVFLAGDAEEVRAALAYARAAAAAPPTLKWEYLSVEQAADVVAITSQIIPSDGDGPGAREAGVVFFVDRALATWAAGQREPFTQGLDELNEKAGKRFARLSTDEQVKLLRASENTPFFQMMRTATVTGFLADPSLGGNKNKAGWTHIGFDDRFQWQPPFGDYDRDAMEGR